jgi:hypothetical protein
VPRTIPWVAPLLLGTLVVAVVLLIVANPAGGARPTDPVSPAQAEHLAGVELTGDPTGHCFVSADALVVSPSAEDFAAAAEMDSPGWVRSGLFAGDAQDVTTAWNGRLASTSTDGAIWLVMSDDTGPAAVKLLPFSGADGTVLWLQAGLLRETDCPAGI